jgi:hypothetical protein
MELDLAHYLHLTMHLALLTGMTIRLAKATP